MPRYIDPYESPARAQNRENRMQRLQDNKAKNIPGYGTPSERNSMGSAPREAGGDDWDKKFGTPPPSWIGKFANSQPTLSSAEQQNVMQGVQQRQALASLPQRRPITPFQTPTPRAMAAGQYKVTNPKTGQLYGTASVRYPEAERLTNIIDKHYPPKKPKTVASTGRKPITPY